MYARRRLKGVAIALQVLCSLYSVAVHVHSVHVTAAGRKAGSTKQDPCATHMQCVVMTGSSHSLHAGSLYYTEL